MKTKLFKPKRQWFAVGITAILTINMLAGQSGNTPTITCPENIVVEADANCSAVVEYEITAEGGSGGEGTTPTQILFASAQENVVYSANLDGTGTPQVYIEGATDRNVIGLFADYDNEKLYMNNGGGNYKGVYVAPLAGDTSGTQLANSNPTANKPKFYTYVDAANDRYFFTEADVNGVYVANLDGSGIATQVVLSGDIPGGIPHGLDFDPETNILYVGAFNQSNLATGAIYAIDMDSGVSEKLFDVGGIRGLQIDAPSNRIFWVQHDSGASGVPQGEIMVASLDRTIQPTVLASVNEAFLNYGYLPADVLFDPSTDELYWSEFTTFDTSRVKKISADGTGQVSTVFTYVNEEEGGYMRGLAFATEATAGGGGGEVTITQTDESGYTSGDAFPVGTTIQEYTATDSNDNTAVCSFTVTVLGDIPEVNISLNELPDFCQGGQLLTASSELAVSYSWSNDGDTESIEITENGTYTVTVTSASGCTASESITISDFDAEALLSSYTLIATDEIHLHDHNIVDGAAGVTVNDGKIKLHDETVISSFAIASELDIDDDSSANPGIEGVANLELPSFYYNTLTDSNSEDVKVEDGLSVTLNESVYSKIEVKDGSHVTFTQPNIFLKELKVEDNGSVSFSQSSNLYLQKKLDLKKNTKFNNENMFTVVVYAQYDVDIEEGSVVNANIYSLKEIDVKGDEDNVTSMRGQFIGDKIKGYKYVNWNKGTNCSKAEVIIPIIETNVACDCKGGMTEITFTFEGQLTDLTTNSGVIYQNMDGSFIVNNLGEKLEKNLEISFAEEVGEIHTSCSQDILGITFAGGITVTGHTDTYGNQCSIMTAEDEEQNNEDDGEIRRNNDMDQSIFTLGDSDVKLWPVPSRDVFNIRLISGDNNDPISIEVFDITSQRILVDQFSKAKPYQFGESLETGIYFVRVKQNTFVKTLRVVKY